MYQIDEFIDQWYICNESFEWDRVRPHGWWDPYTRVQCQHYVINEWVSERWSRHAYVSTSECYLSLPWLESNVSRQWGSETPWLVRSIYTHFSFAFVNQFNSEWIVMQTLIICTKLMNSLINGIYAMRLSNETEWDPMVDEIHILVSNVSITSSMNEWVKGDQGMHMKVQVNAIWAYHDWNQMFLDNGVVRPHGWWDPYTPTFHLHLSINLIVNEL